MSRTFYDINPAGDVVCTYIDGGEEERLRSVSALLSTWPAAQSSRPSRPC